MAKTPYKNPRLVETLCEIHFEPGPAWDATLFGLFYERIRDAFPEKRELRNVEVGVQADDRELSQYVREAGEAEKVSVVLDLDQLKSCRWRAAPPMDE